MESTQVLELTQTLEASQTTDTSNVLVKVGCLKINGKDYFVWNKENTIGRDESCDIVIDSKAVSVEHAIIEADAFGKHLIWDQGSTNKTRLGEVQLKPRVRHYLNDGARLRFANVNAVYHHLKVISPERPLRSEPAATRTPGTPERAEEDEAAAVASIAADLPAKGDEDDASSDGDFFGDQDPSTLFINHLRLLEDRPAPLGAQNSNGAATSIDESALSTGQVVNESSVCEADATGDADLSDVIAGSQPIFTPEKVSNIYEVDTVPVNRVEETPVKASKNDGLDWENINDTIHQISQEMDTIDSLIEKKELCVQFTPTKKFDETAEAENVITSATGNAEPSAKSSTTNRNLDNYFEDSIQSRSNPQESSNKLSSPSHKLSIYDAETEPVHNAGSIVEGANIFDLATQEVQGVNVDVIEGDTSLHDLATQQFVAAEEEKPVEGGLSDAGDISVCDMPTQAPGRQSPSPVVDDLQSINTPSRGELSQKAVPKALSRNGKTPADSSFYDMLTQAADPSNARVSESPARRDEPGNLDVSLSDMATQICIERKPSPIEVTVSEPTGGCDPKSGLDANTFEMVTRKKEDEFMRPHPSRDDLCDMLTQPVVASSRDNAQQILPRPRDVSVLDTPTHATGSCADESISDLQTQFADLPQKRMPNELPSDDISLSDLQTQVVDLPQKMRLAEEPTTADMSISDMQTQLARNSPNKECLPTDGPESADIYDALTQMPVADRQIMCEDSNTVNIEQELDSYEQGCIDTSVPPFKTPALIAKASPRISPSDSGADDVYVLDTQPMDVSASPSSATSADGFKPSKTERSEDVGKTENQPTAVSLYDMETQDVGNKASKPAVPSVFRKPAATSDISKTENNTAGMTLYDFENQDVGKADGVSAPVATSMYDIDAEDVSKAENQDFSIVDTVPSPKAESAIKDQLPEITVEKDSDEPCVLEISALNDRQPRVRRCSRDLDANSVENRIRAMNDTNVNSPDVRKVNTKSTVAELLEALEGTPSLPVHRAQNPGDSGVSQNSDTASQFPMEKPRKKAKALVYSDSDESVDTPTVRGSEDKHLPTQTVATSTDSELSQNGNARCSQFPVEKHKKVKALVYSDSEDSCETNPSLLQRISTKPTEALIDECAMPQKADGKTEVCTSPGLCNGNSTLSKEGFAGTSDVEGSSVSNIEHANGSERVLESVTNRISGKVSGNNDTGGSESLRLHLTDMSVDCSVSVSERPSLPVGKESETDASVIDSSPKRLEDNRVSVGRAQSREGGKITPENTVLTASSKTHENATVDVSGKSKIEGTPEKSGANMSLTVIPTSDSEDEASNAHVKSHIPFEEVEPNATGSRSSVLHTTLKSAKHDSEKIFTLPLKPAESSPRGGPSTATNSEPETPEIPKDFFGSPVIHDQPPKRRYVHTPKKSAKKDGGFLLPLKPGEESNLAGPSTGTTSEPETPEIPKDFFGSPVIHDRPPLRTYVNKKKLSLNVSCLSTGPNASSTPLSDRDSHSVVDMEETLLPTIPKADGKKAKERNDHQDSQSETPKNVKKFKKSPIKQPSEDSQMLSQESETLSSQYELTDSQELGRGKRKRVRKNFLDFVEDDTPATRKVPSPRPCSTGEINTSTSSKNREHIAAQPPLDVPPELPDSNEDSPRKERPRKQAFMSCESNEARITAGKYKNDACYVKSPKPVGGPSKIPTIAVEPESPGRLDLAKMKNSLKASLSRKHSAESANPERSKATTPVKLVPGVPDESTSPRKSTSVVESSGETESSSQPAGSNRTQRGRSKPKSKFSPSVPSCEVPANHEDVDSVLETPIGGQDSSKSPVRSGRGRNRHGEAKTPEKGVNAGIGREEFDSSTNKEATKDLPDEDDPMTVPKSSVLPRRGRRRKDAATPEPSSNSQGLLCSSVAAPDENDPKLKKERRRGRGYSELPNSQDSKPELSQESLSSVCVGVATTQLDSQDTLPEKMDEGTTRGRRKRKISANSDIVHYQEGDDGRNQKKPITSEENRLTCEPAAAASLSPPKRSRGRQPKPTSSTPLPETKVPLDTITLEENASSTPKQDELSHESKPEATSSSARRGRRKRGHVETAKSTEIDDQSLELSQKSHESSQKCELGVAGSAEGESRRSNRKGGKQIASENTANDSLSDSQPSGYALVTQRRYKRNVRAPQLFEDFVVEADTEVSASEATTVSRARGRPKNAVKNAADASLPVQKELSVELPGVSQTRGRRKRVADDSVTNSQPAHEERSAGEISTAPKTRRGRKRVADDSVGSQPTLEEMSATDVPSASMSGGRRKKVAETSVVDSHHEVSDTEVPSASRPRGRRKKLVEDSVDDSQPDHEEPNGVEVPSSSKTRGRRRKVEDSVDNSIPAQEDPSATNDQNASKRRGRPKKAVDELLAPNSQTSSEASSASKPRGRKPKQAAEEPPEINSSQDLSQSRRSGRARKKKESFDELMSRKEEEIRLKKLQQQPPTPDKSRLSFVTPSASIASVGDDSAFSIPTSPSSSVSSKRSASRLGASATESLLCPSKKRKKEDVVATPLSGQVKVMFTGLADTKLAAMVKKLGGKVTEKPTECTVLVTDKVKRTVKFLCALGMGKPIVSPNWISKSKAFSQFADPEESLLKDAEGESKFEFELSSSLEVAKSKKLLEGYSVHATASVLPPPKEMKPIIECSGGTFLSKPPAKWPSQSVVISDPKDKTEWPKLNKHGVTPPILSAEAILTGILRQMFEVEKHRLK